MKKYLVISDIHGSAKYLDLVIDRFNSGCYQKLLVLGDLYYHGPRNPIPEGYDPLVVAETLNSLGKKIKVCRGNCDAEVDEMISKFDIKKCFSFKLGGKKVICYHGHDIGPQKLPNNDFDLFLYGHFHIGKIDKIAGRVVASPGSITLPKDQHHSFMEIDDQGGIKLFDLLNGNLLAEDVF